MGYCPRAPVRGRLSRGTSPEEVFVRTPSMEYTPVLIVGSTLYRMSVVFAVSYLTLFEFMNLSLYTCQRNTDYYDTAPLEQEI